MSQQIQELIEKIKNEGIQAAQQKAKEIEEQARKQAATIIEEAQKKKTQLIQEAKNEIQRMQDAAHMALKQASRDTLLNLRQQINSILKTVISNQTAAALTPEQLANIIGTVIKQAVQKSKGGESIEVVLSPHDLEKIKHGFLNKLQQELRRPIQFQASEEIHKGFTISFDGGKSSFDFTDESLADYLSTYVSEELTAILKEAVKS